VCASESFAFLTRWLPADERRGPNRSLRPPPAAVSEAPSPTVRTWVTRGLAGIVVMAIGRMFLRPTDTSEKRENVKSPS
jgi:hypothetical protein